MESVNVKTSVYLRQAKFSLCLLLICVYVVCNKWASAADEKKLPSLWSRLPGKEKAYHVVYQFEMSSEDKVSAYFRPYQAKTILDH